MFLIYNNIYLYEGNNNKLNKNGGEIMSINLILECLLRIVLAGVGGICIGINRELHAKDAGVRTHFFVAVGSALLMVVSKYGFLDMKAFGMSADASRIASQVVSGIGFLGAGSIMVNKRSIHGLTTAAGLWATAAIGLSFGAGLYWISVVVVILTLLGYGLSKYISKLMPSRMKTMRIVLKVDSIFAVEDFLYILSQNEYNIVSYGLKFEQKDDYYQAKITLNALRSSKSDSKRLMEDIEEKYTLISFDITG